MTEITVSISGPVGCGKSAIAGEIEIALNALGIPVRFADEKEMRSEKNMTGADWTGYLEMYKPSVVIVEQISPSPSTNVRASQIITAIRKQLEINVQIAERDHPEGPMIDGKRVKGICHSQDILAQHIREHLDELERLIASPAPQTRMAGWQGMASAPRDGTHILAILYREATSDMDDRHWPAFSEMREIWFKPYRAFGMELPWHAGDPFEEPSGIGSEHMGEGVPIAWQALPAADVRALATTEGSTDE